MMDSSSQSGCPLLVKTKMKQIITTKKTVCLCDDEDYGILSKYTWYDCNGYAYAKEKGKMFSMHRFLMKTPVGMDTDHINHNKLDNRKKNLRVCTKSQNCINAKCWFDKKYKGVKKCGKGGLKFRACLKGKYSKICNTEEQAALEYNKMATRKYKEFAYLNKV